MDAEAVVADLVDRDILEPTADDRYAVSDEFAAAVESTRDRLQSSAASSYTVDEFEVPLTASTLDAVATVETTSTEVPDLSTKRCLDLSLVLAWFLTSVPEQEGAPEQFLPIHGEWLPLVEAMYSPAIVYIYRHDCPPCDLVRGDFEELFDPSPPAGLSLFSVYGPDATTVLKDAYDVAGGPAVLFLANGRVDTRLYGAQDPKVLAAEVEKIQSRHRDA